MLEKQPDPDVVSKLTEMHIEEPEMIASILAKHGVTLCDPGDCVDDPPD